MDILSGFEEKGLARRVYHLKKSPYGLKHSSRTWFNRFRKVLKIYGCSWGKSIALYFHKQFTEGKLTILIVYINDIILIRDDKKKL